MPAFADELRDRGAGLRVLNLGGGEVDTATPMGSMLFTIMAALAQWNARSNANALPIPSANAEKLEKTLAADPAGSPTVRFEALSAWSKAARPLRRLPALSECPEQHFIDGREHSRTSRVASPLGRHQAITERRQGAIQFHSVEASMGMDSPDDFAGGFLFANTWAFGKVCCNCQRRELVRDVLGDVEDDVGTLAGTGLYEEPVPDEGIEVLAAEVRLDLGIGEQPGIRVRDAGQAKARILAQLCNVRRV